MDLSRYLLPELLPIIHRYLDEVVYIKMSKKNLYYNDLYLKKYDDKDKTSGIFFIHNNLYVVDENHIFLYNESDDNLVLIAETGKQLLGIKGTDSSLWLLYSNGFTEINFKRGAQIFDYKHPGRNMISWDVSRDNTLIYIDDSKVYIHGEKSSTIYNQRPTDNYNKVRMDRYVCLFNHNTINIYNRNMEKLGMLNFDKDLGYGWSLYNGRYANVYTNISIKFKNEITVLYSDRDVSFFIDNKENTIYHVNNETGHNTIFAGVNMTKYNRCEYKKIFLKRFDINKR